MKGVVLRLGWAAFVVWAAVSLAFAINELLPGDPARMVAGVQARPADVARIRVKLGLGRPPIVRYALFWHRLVHIGPRTVDPQSDAHATCGVVAAFGRSAIHVDFGKSFQLHEAVVDVIAVRLPRTVALAVAGVGLSVLFGVVSGTFAAIRQRSWIDRLLVSTSLLGISAPTFIIGLALQYVLARHLRWLPIDGFGSGLAEHARCLVMPALTLGIYGAAYYTRLVRDEMCRLLGSAWVRTARAKGLAPHRVVIRHALRNAAVPIVTSIGLDFGAMMGGAIVTETVFRWPGLGDLSVHATLDRDGPVLCGCLVVTAVAVVLANVIVDMTYPILDPRTTDRRASGTR